MAARAVAVLAALGVSEGLRAQLVPAEVPAAQALPLPVLWVHTPKCGTSFANVLYHHTGLCPRTPENAYLQPGEQWSDFVKRHPPTRNCPGAFAERFDGDHWGLGDAWFRLQDKDKGRHVFAFFRQPEQRLISGWLDKQHDWPISIRPSHILEYATHMRGCGTRMLTRGGMPCGESIPQPGKIEVAIAVERVKELGFVGLTDQWELSVCLFYATYGGNCTDGVFSNTRSGQKRRDNKQLYNATAYLGRFQDAVDGPVYEEAQRVFWRRFRERGLSPEVCAMKICRRATRKARFGLRDPQHPERLQRVQLARAAEGASETGGFGDVEEPVYDED